MLVVTQCLDVDDLTSVMVDFKEACAPFQQTLCDSRCIIYGPKKDLEKAVDTRKGYCLIDCNVDHEAFTKEDVKIEDLSEAMTDFSLKIYITLKSRITVVHRSDADSLRLRSPFEGKEGAQEHEEVAQDSRYSSNSTHPLPLLCTYYTHMPIASFPGHSHRRYTGGGNGLGMRQHAHTHTHTPHTRTPHTPTHTHTTHTHTTHTHTHTHTCPLPPYHLHSFLLARLHYVNSPVVDGLPTKCKLAQLTILALNM